MDGAITHARLAELDARGDAYALLTVIAVRGSSPREAGARMILHADGRLEGSIGGGGLEQDALRDARALLEGRTPGDHLVRGYALNMARDQCCGGEVEVYVRVQRARPQVVLVGAGHVAHAIAHVLDGTPFDVTVIDDRAEWNTAERFPRATRIVDAPEDVLLDHPLAPERTYALLLSHSHKRDFEALRLLVPRRLRYLGLIGSRSKWARFRTALLAQGVDPALVDAVRSPIGVGVGGKAPAEIAISVAAELLAVRDGVRVTQDTSTLR